MIHADTMNIYSYRLQRSWAKVIFSQACVKNSVHSGEGVCLGYTPPWTRQPPGPGRHPPRPGRPPWTRQTPPDQADPPRTRQTPPGSRLQHTVYERPVGILLECILVQSALETCPAALRVLGTSAGFINTSPSAGRYTGSIHHVLLLLHLVWFSVLLQFSEAPMPIVQLW